MRPLKHIALAAFVTLSTFSVLLYSSCVKNECGAVTCLNDGECTGGICKCVTGTDGANCEVVYRKTYAGVYKGVPPDDPNSDTTNSLIFSASDDTTNYNLMDVTWVDTAARTVVTLPIELSNNTSGGSNFTITPTTITSVYYTGNGVINRNTVSLQLKRRYSNGAVDAVVFNNYIRQ
jgi:hypothetical protein